MKKLYAIFLVLMIHFSVMSQIQYEISSQNFEDLIAVGIAVGDIDNDGDLDICYDGVKDFNGQFPYESYLYLNDGLGNFVASSPFEPALGFILLEDFDNDGDLDYIKFGITDSNNAKVVKIYKNEGDGEFILISNNDFIPLQQVAGVSIDFDNDGDMDIFYHGGNSSQQAFSYLYKNNGNFNFSLDQSFTGLAGYNVVKGDIDGDGDSDIINSGGDYAFGYTFLLRNNGGIFTEETTLIKTAEAIALADIDNDGDLDCFSIGVDAQGHFRELRLNNGNGIFDEIIALPLPNILNAPNALFTDSDLDGDPDLYVTAQLLNYDRYSRLLKNNENNNFVHSGFDFEDIYGGEAVAYDFNNDGYEDIFHAGNSGGYYPFEIPTTILYLNTTGLLNINDNLKNLDILIYPNPTSKYLNIKSNSDVNIIQTTLTNISGRLIYGTISNNRIDVSCLSNGLYFLKIQTEKGIITKKFIKD